MKSINILKYLNLSFFGISLLLPAAIVYLWSAYGLVSFSKPYDLRFAATQGAIGLSLVSMIFNKKLRLVLASVWLITFIFFVGTEIFFRVCYLSHNGFYNAMISTPDNLFYNVRDFKLDTKMDSINPPGGISYTKGIRIEMNSNGFRGRNWNEEKIDGHYRILIVGASITQGHGVELVDRYSNVLEVILNSRSENQRKFEVINISSEFLGNHGILDLAKKYSNRYSPDLLILSDLKLDTDSDEILLDEQLVDNIRADKFLIEKRQLSVTGHIESLLVYPASALYFSRFLFSINQSRLDFSNSAQISEKDSEILVSRLITGLRYYGPKIAAINSPKKAVLFLRSTLKGGPPMQVPEIIPELLDPIGIQIIDTYDINMDEPILDRIIYPGDSHPSPKIHRKYAISISKQLNKIITGKY